ncbi:MAG: VWA domain-containing protein [Candidatus Acidiferrum sp.]
MGPSARPFIRLLDLHAPLVLALLLVPLALSSQESPQTPQIHVSTQLVQIGIIVRDKNGPVAGLTKDDFSVFDRGKAQRISVFSVESDASARPERPTQPLPPNTFSDQVQYMGDKPRSVTVVLLDNLNTLSGNGHEGYETSPWWMEDLALSNAKAHLIEFIRTLDPRDRVAIYGLGDTLHVLSDFTSDRERLLAILKRYDTTSRTNRDEVEPGKWHTPVPGEFNPLLDAQALQLSAITNERRAEATMSALQSIASHVANIPGRKNLVWLTANLPFSDVALARILSPAQIAAYPVDGRALMTRRTPETQWEIDDQLDGVLGRGAPAQSSQPIGVDTMRELADETGGRAFVNTNDLTGAIRDAVEDSAVTYTLGFYINSDSLDGKFHELKVKAKRSGLQLRYPKGYFALKENAATQDEGQNNLVAALRSPLESASIPVQVRVVRVEQPLPHCLSLFGLIDIRNLRLEQTGAVRKGAVEVATIEQDETGKILRQSASRINFNFKERQYDAYLKSGFTFHQYVQPQAGVTTLRIVIEDMATAQVGSLIIPLTSVN